MWNKISISIILNRWRILSRKIEESILFSNNIIISSNSIYQRSIIPVLYVTVHSLQNNEKAQEAGRIGSGPESGSRRMGNMLTAA